MIIKVNRTSETNYTELPEGEIEVSSIESFAKSHNAIISGNTITAEWGDGEGEDTYEFEVIES